jgi:uncharacterized membrane protein
MEAPTPHLEGLPVSTYLLENLTAPLVERIQRTKPEVFDVRRGRAILVSCLAPPEEVTARVIPGNLADVVRTWIDRSVVEELEEEYRRTKPTDDAREEAILVWQEARKARADSENALRRATVERARAAKYLEETKEREYVASAGLVKTHGRRMIMIDGAFWDLIYTADTAYWRKRRTNAAEKDGK